MEVRCRIELRYSSVREAEKVLEAVSVDNDDYVSARREGSRLISEISSGSVMGLVHTVEDYLACVSVAEKAIKVAEERPRARGPPHPSRRRASRRGS